MPAARICSLAEVAHLLPPDCALAERLREGTNSLDEATAIVITGPWRCPELHLPDMLGQGSPLRHLLDPETQSSALRTLVLILVEGDLDIDGALTGHDDDGEPPCLVVLGSARMHNLILCEASLHVRGDLVVQDLLWGDGISTALQVHGHLQARVALLADAFQVQMASTMHVEFLMDEVSGVPHLAEFSSEIVDAVFPLEFHDGINAGEKGLGLMLDRDSVIAAVRAGTNATRTSEEIHTLLPIDTSLCPGGALTAEHLLQLLRTPLIAHKEHTASGWFKQTDFYLCRRHVDAEGDQRADNVFITVWKTWDFYISVEHVPEAKGLLARWTAFRQRRTIPTHPELTVAYRSYTDGQPGEWGVLGGMDAPDVVADPAQAEARAACQNAWRGVLDYVRKAVGQHKAHYPLYQQVQAELTARHVEDFTSLPVFTERYNDWWDSENNGHWQDEVWVGARQPCMHDGEPWGRALKFGWQNGSPAHGDYDDAHSTYQIDVDEARNGPALVEFTYAQRQSEARVSVPRGAADHWTRLLRFYRLVQARLHDAHEQAQAREAEARRIEAAVHLLAVPPLASDVPDAAVFPVELMTLSEQWQASGAAYVAAIRSHQLANDARLSRAGDGDEQEETEKDGDEKAAAQQNNAPLPSEPRKDAAPTVLQLARVVNAHGDGDLSERFHQRFAFAPDAFSQCANDAGRFVGPVIALDDGRVLARIGSPYEDDTHWVAVHDVRHTPLTALQGLGRSHDRQVFAQSDGQQVTTHRGFEGPVIARFDLPRGNEGLPPHMAVGAGPEAQRCDEIIPFNDGQRVLLLNPTGVYLLTVAGSSAAVKRLHPQSFDEDGPYTWPKNQASDETDDEGDAALSLAMLHMALSPDERYIAVGDQDSSHILLDVHGTVLAEYDPLSSYPHHAVFSHDSTRLFANACHFYNGCTLSVSLPPRDASADADGMPLLDSQCRVYASATQPGLVILGSAHGYLHAIGDDRQRLWRHHIGSTISGIDISPDGNTLWAASYGGYLVQLERSEAGMDPYSIGTSPYVETSRWIFWKDEATPLRW